MLHEHGSLEVPTFGKLPVRARISTITVVPFGDRFLFLDSFCSVYSSIVLHLTTLGKRSRHLSCLMNCPSRISRWARVTFEHPAVFNLIKFFLPGSLIFHGNFP